MSKRRLIDGYTKYRMKGGRHTRKDFSTFRWNLRMTPDEILAEEIATYGECGPNPSLNQSPSCKHNNGYKPGLHQESRSSRNA